jgi:hypothetical protein
MRLPFTVEQFLQIFKDYNESIFPLQIFFYLMAVAILFVAIKRIEGAGKIINSVLAFFWAWMGIVYHLMFFTTINKAAYVFGGFFILEAVLFFYLGVIKRKLTYRFKPDKSGVIGSTLIIFALIIYPLLGYLFGHVYPVAPTFGVPCPTTIFTFGILLWSDNKIPKIILVVPFLWSILGFSAATNLGIREDIGLLIAGVVAAASLLLKTKVADFS